MDRRPDPWEDALGRWTADTADEATRTLDAAGAPADPQANRAVAVTTPRIVTAAAIATVLVAIATAGAVLTVLNRDRADRWRDRSVALQELVEERTRALNRQTARLNVAASTLRDARSAITRSEADVKALEARQRELANEKAAIEDERAQLVLVASALNDCRGELTAIVTSGIDPALIDLSSAQIACSNADSAVEGYLAAFR